MPLVVPPAMQAARRLFSARGAKSVSALAAPGPGASGIWLTVIPAVAETGNGRGNGGVAAGGGALFIATFASSALSARNGSTRPYPNWLSRPFGPRFRAVE